MPLRSHCEQALLSAATSPELRVLFMEEFCGCGRPEAAYGALLRLLRLHDDHRDQLKEWVADEGIEYLLLYWLYRMGLTAHGGSVGGGWLTDKGKAVLAGLEREAEDDFERLTGDYCVHGYGIEDGVHNCFESDAW